MSFLAIRSDTCSTVRSLKPSSLPELAREVPARSRANAARMDVRRMVMGLKVTASARGSSTLLHLLVEDAGAVVMDPAGGGIPSLEVERLRRHLCIQGQLCCASISGFLFEEPKQRNAH